MYTDIQNGKYKNQREWVRKAENPELHAAYQEESARLHAQFKADLLDEFGLTHHPKADEIFDYVWQEGHAYGHSEVYSKMSGIYHLFE
jgi:hypothetical protein